jgi:uncharacterized membrane protein
MGKGLRTTLWILSSLAVLWTLTALIEVFTMGSMMRGGMMRGDHMMGGGGMMGGMIVHMALTWIVMLGLDGVFVYLVTAGRRASIVQA